MKFNQELITKARKGEIAILNDGSVEELREVLNNVFPNDLMTPKITSITCKYFLPHPKDNECWMGETSSTLPAHSVKEFFMPDTMTDTEIAERISQQSFQYIQQPRTYKVTRQQMKEIWEAAKDFATDEFIVGLTKNLFGVFSDQEELDEREVKQIVSSFPIQQVPGLVKSIFPEYFFIPEGEPVLYQNERGGIVRIGISDGKGHVYLDNRTEGLPLTVHQIIPFTKNPPK